MNRRYLVATFWGYWGVRDTAIVLKDGDDPESDRVFGSASRELCVKKCRELNAQHKAQQLLVQP